jgi:DNA-binding CsgD family transcriptional regulator
MASTKPLLRERERECLRLLAEGEGDRAIATRLGIRVRTVRFHVEKAKKRLSAKNRMHCVALALRMKLID